MPSEKENRKMLRTLAKKMPAMQESYDYNLLINGDRLKIRYEAAGKDQSDIDPKKRYTVKITAQRKADHYRYLRRIFDQSGTQGVLKYIDEIEQKLLSDRAKA